MHLRVATSSLSMPHVHMNHCDLCLPCAAQAPAKKESSDEEEDDDANEVRTSALVFLKQLWLRLYAGGTGCGHSAARRTVVTLRCCMDSQSSPALQFTPMSSHSHCKMPSLSRGLATPLQMRAEAHTHSVFGSRTATRTTTRWRRLLPPPPRPL